MSWNIGPYQPYLVVIEDPSPMSFISILFSLLELDKKDSSGCRGLFLVVIRDYSLMSLILTLFLLPWLDKKDSSACRGWFSFAHVNWCTILDKQMNQTQIKYNFKSKPSRFKSSPKYILLFHESERGSLITMHCCLGRILNYHLLLFCAIYLCSLELSDNEISFFSKVNSVLI